MDNEITKVQQKEKEVVTEPTEAEQNDPAMVEANAAKDGLTTTETAMREAIKKIAEIEEHVDPDALNSNPEWHQAKADLARLQQEVFVLGQELEVAQQESPTVDSLKNQLAELRAADAAFDKDRGLPAFNEAIANLGIDINSDADLTREQVLGLQDLYTAATTELKSFYDSQDGLESEGVQLWRERQYMEQLITDAIITQEEREREPGDNEHKVRRLSTEQRVARLSAVGTEQKLSLAQKYLLLQEKNDARFKKYFPILTQADEARRLLENRKAVEGSDNRIKPMTGVPQSGNDLGGLRYSYEMSNTIDAMS